MNVIIENSRILTSFLFWIYSSWSTLKPAFTVENVIGIFNIFCMEIVLTQENGDIFYHQEMIFSRSSTRELEVGVLKFVRRRKDETQSKAHATALC